jgi:hypothetical protein
MRNRLGRIFPALVLAAAAVMLGLGCRTDDGATTPPAKTQKALLPPVWEKPRISAAWVEPPVELVVKLYEVRHDELDRKRVAADAKSVLEGAPDADTDFGRPFLIRPLAKGDAFLAELETWCKAPTPAAVLVETIRASRRNGVGFEWDIPTDAIPSIVDLSFAAKLLDDGQIRLTISRTPVLQLPVDQTNYIPGFDRDIDNQIDIASHQSVAIGGLTIRQPKAPTLERRGLRLVTVAEETVELLAIVSVAPQAAGDTP